MQVVRVNGPCIVNQTRFTTTVLAFLSTVTLALALIAIITLADPISSRHHSQNHTPRLA